MPESTNSVTKSLREHCADLLAQCDAGEMAPVEALEDIRATLARPEPTQDLSQLSDGCHTFAELYQHRHALCLALMRAMPQHCWFSWRHADGEQCFGSNDWFIAGIELPGGSSVTYHLPAELYPAAQATGATELAKGRPWDGHTSSDVAMRLKEWAALAQPEPQGPTDDGPTNQEIEEWADAAAQVPLEEMDPEVHGWRRCFKPDEFGETIRAALARFGRPAIEPVPVSERLPEPEDCCQHPRRKSGEWCWGQERARTSHGLRAVWRFMNREDIAVEAEAWAPWWAIPLPVALHWAQQEVE
jgi:hypothetical protein